jgi:hypothetical protein
VQRATAQSKTGFFRDFGVAEAPPGFQAGWSDCMCYFSLFLFILLNRENFERDLIYTRFSKRRFHPVPIISTPLRAKYICRPQVYSRRRRRTKWPISMLFMHFALCKEQQHSQKHELFVIMV